MIKSWNSYLVLYSSVNNKNNKLLYKKLDSLGTNSIKLDSLNMTFFKNQKV